MRFAIATLGCKVNQYDSALIEARLTALGGERIGFDQAAEVYIVNTCTVTDRADTESLRLARRARRLNPAARIIMTGCLAQASPGLLARSHEVDAVVGLGRLGDLERAAAGDIGERVMVSNLRKEVAPIEIGAVTLDGHTRAFLKVQEGCDRFCSFCIVPMSRGKSRSVEPRRIIEAIDGLAAQGFKEVTLSGVHLGGYGRDLNPPVELEDLLEMLAERSSITRIRISSLDPEELSDRIIAILSKSAKFCPHLHLPLQSGEDATLARMRRRYTAGYFRDRIDAVVAAMPEAGVGTDLIVGFPGETAQQFEQYFKFVESLPLSYFHVFPYSVRAGTSAAKFDGRVAPAELKLRAAAMRALGEYKRAEFARRFIGMRLKVLLEEVVGEGRLRGYSRNYVRVVTNGDAELTNCEVEVEGSLAQGAELVARMVSPAETRSDGSSVGSAA
ncbi:MAG TPA: tRNA (N(6)-L-threonylcarbamoyladenosine(37)-C(2))-methylthiotransferase MtaB [Candidatus Binataceae bacterium]|nr:tRNA (N(6)-L-threonylcarbamoyladenosine(37)-C(2))-methylthiotransferase MtaB [Candidatus Binataceae bacterium]